MTDQDLDGSHIKGLCITNCDGPFDPCEDYPAARLVVRSIMGRKIVNIVPEEELEKKSWTMMGGNYGGTSDSRFGDKVEEMMESAFYGAVPIHDRVE